LQDIPDSLSQSKIINTATYTPPTIRPDDILNITIQTIDLSANQILNQGNLPVMTGAVASNNSSSQSTIAGYLVSKEGFIHMPYIGNVQVSNLTTEQVRDTVLSKISVYFRDPVVNVRFANFKVTVLGEVQRPSTFIIPNEKPTIIDALGLAGDITIYGKRDNVMLIRDSAGAKEIARLNLDSSKVINSQYFYLKPNDVIYVEASPTKVQSTNSYRNRDIAIIGAVLSLLVAITYRLTR